MISAIITHGTCFIFGGIVGMLLMCMMAANSNDYVDIYEEDSTEKDA